MKHVTLQIFIIRLSLSLYNITEQKTYNEQVNHADQLREKLVALVSVPLQILSLIQLLCLFPQVFSFISVLMK